jgi:hypothetical protein
MPLSDRFDAAAFVAYLDACGGSDTFRTWDADGRSDTAAARDFAEDLRERLGDRLDVSVSVEQSFNRVTVSKVLEAAHV